MNDEWFIPRAELERMEWEWVPDSCPTLISIIEEVNRDETCPGVKVYK